MLNSIYYPDAGDDGLKIRKLDSRQPTFTKLNKKYNKDTLATDILCECDVYKAEDENNKANQESIIFNVETQAKLGIFY